jgi:hypothetical protein
LNKLEKRPKGSLGVALKEEVGELEEVLVLKELRNENTGLALLDKLEKAERGEGGRESADSDVETESEALPKYEKNEKPQGSKIRYAFVCVAAFLLFFAVVGIFHSVNYISDRYDHIVSRRDLKDEIALFIYPVVINDPPTFLSVQNLPDSTIITSAVWKIILTGDKSRYDTDFGVIYIPAADVELAARSLFGTGSLNHQSVSSREIDFIFDAETRTYQIPDNPSLFSYTPSIVSVTNIGETYTAIVDYMMPGIHAVAGMEREDVPIKTMIYTITRSREIMTIVSVQSGVFDN